ncbi:LPS biosynthesis protein [Steroidobacter agaridevorans]|uniref:LPS biosynthesis protein n=1 Tax=Steroidobacter agaridevorans TaxID=2695856 RepID=A0A829YGT4_9GAMM|nr:Wzz/FepE/Etk N-terminal domain-containing protein [Steroidobacter agaridevorans]GFE82008.1 LPS biosynthesis protein [Steroidobacter agaridevorans]GFE85603.1 LPS biosynthesis protein [Steroidobacter agaridevorans]
MNATVAQAYDEEFIDIRELLARLRTRWMWILASVVVCTALTSAMAFLSTPVYRGSVVLTAADSEVAGMSGGLGSALGQLGGLASLAGISVGADGSATEEALAVLRSRQFTDAFIRDLQLMPILFPKLWDKQTGTWRTDIEAPPTPAQAYKYFDKRVRSIFRDKKTNLVTVNVDWRDRELAAQWANELVQRLNAEMRARAIERTNASVGYLETELKTTTTVATRDAINRLIETQIKQRMLANVTPEYAFRVVDKALPPDADDPIKPKKLLLLVAGPVIGLALGVVGVLILFWVYAPPRRAVGA